MTVEEIKKFLDALDCGYVLTMTSKDKTVVTISKDVPVDKKKAGF